MSLTLMSLSLPLTNAHTNFDSLFYILLYVLITYIVFQQELRISLKDGQKKISDYVENPDNFPNTSNGRIVRPTSAVSLRMVVDLKNWIDWMKSQYNNLILKTKTHIDAR